MEYYWQDEVQSEETTVTVSQRNRGCCIHQTVMTTQPIQTHPTDDQQKLRELATDALRQIDDGNYNSVARLVAAIEAVVAQLKKIEATMAREKNRVEKLENVLAELKRERYMPWWGKMAGAVVAGALLPDGMKDKLRVVRDVLNFFLNDNE